MSRIHWYPAVAGLLLLLLLPVGVLGGLNSLLYSAVFFLHLIILLTGTAFMGASLSLRTYSDSHLTKFTWGVIILVVLVTIFAGIHPITAKDALIHHLAVPKWWVQSNSPTPIYWHEWSYYPMLLQLAYAEFLKLGLEMVTPIYHFLWLLLLSFVVGDFLLEESDDKEIAVFSVLLTLGLPVAMNLASTPLVDLGVGFFTTATLLSVIKFYRTGAYHFLFLAGASLGLSLGVKYNALPVFALLPFLIALLRWRYQFSVQKAAYSLVIILGVALLFALPWLCRNYFATGNPLHPLFGNLFGGKIAAAHGGINLSPLQHRIQMEGEGPLEILLTPFKMILMARDGDPGRYDGVLSPLFLLAFFPLFLRRKGRYAFRWLLPLAVLVVGYYVIALSQTSWRIRYLAPLFGPLVIFSSVGLLFLRDKLPSARLKYWCVALAVGAQTILSLWYGISLVRKNDAIPYALGELDKETYLSSHLREYPTIAFVNQNVPSDEKVYLLYTSNQFYYYEREVYSAGYRSERDVLKWLRASSDGSGLIEGFRSGDFNYLVTNRALLLKGLSSVLSDAEKIAWTNFYNEHLQEIYTSGDYTLWKIH